jgi:hypothetical protein
LLRAVLQEQVDDLGLQIWRLSGRAPSSFFTEVAGHAAPFNVIKGTFTLRR